MGRRCAAFDLNSLIDPNSGWLLTRACDISPNGEWITGIGLYDPDGAGPQASYGRAWTMEVPEPSIMALLLMTVPAILARRRR